MSNLGFRGDRAWFDRTSHDDSSCPRSSCYAVLLPDADERLFIGNEGLKIVDIGGNDGILHAAKLEDGHYALLYPDFCTKDGKEDGLPRINTSDNPAVTFAVWHATDMPMPRRRAGRGRMMWHIPGAGDVWMFYNEKKEDMNYRADYLEKSGAQVLVERFGGYPIVLDPDAAPQDGFNLNFFLTENRLYQLRDGDGAFMTRLVGKKERSTEEEQRTRWERPVDPKIVLAAMPLLAHDLNIPLRVVMKGANGRYQWFGPFKM